MKIVGNTVGTSLPKPNLSQTDPKKGDYVKGKDDFSKEFASTFVAVYGTTTMAEIYEAYQAGKSVVCSVSNRTTLALVGCFDTVAQFGGVTANGMVAALCSEDGWSIVTRNVETNITESSDVYHFPTAKAVYDFVQNKDVDLTGYATEQFVIDGYQPKGDYLTEVPDGYAKTEDIPTKPAHIGAQPAGDYLTAVPAGYATEEFVTNKIAEAELGGKEVDLSGYAQKSELPTKVSQLQNDAGYLTEHQDISGKLDTSALPTAINTALEQAKASGEFDGKDGQDGQDGYTPQKNVDYFDGQPGKDGSNGKDGTSVTHSWNGTTLTVTSASGTSSANLKGDKGDSIKGDPGSPGADGVSPTVAVSKSGKVTTISITDKNGTKTATVNDGADGSAGSAGKDGTSVTVKSVSESTADGGNNVVTFSDGKTVTIKNGSKGSAGSNGSNGVSVSSVKQTTTSSADGGSNVVTVTLSNGTTSTFTVKNGSKGSTGSAGKTPVKGVDYWTAADQEAIVQQVIVALGTPVFGRVDADNNIILTGNLVDGTYTVKYEDGEGNVTEVGEIAMITPEAVEYGIVYGMPERVGGSDYSIYYKDNSGETNYKMIYQTTGEAPLHLNGISGSATNYYPLAVPAGATKLVVNFPNLGSKKVILAGMAVSLANGVYTRTTNYGWMNEGVYEIALTGSPEYVIVHFRNNGYTGLDGYNTDGMTISWE